MAERLDSLVERLSCQICNEDFEEEGDHVPRILPCSHTLCQTCIAKLIAQNMRNKIDCPVCRETHDAKRFPQNKDVLMLIKHTQARTPDSVQDAPEPADPCPEHGKELSLFCKEPGCQKSICSKCLTQHHKKHEVVDIEEDIEENPVEDDLSRSNHSVLVTDIDNVMTDLKGKSQKLSEVKERCTEKTEVCLNKLKKTKEEMNKQFDKMIKTAEDKKKEVHSSIDHEMSVIDGNLAFLMSLEENIEFDTNEDLIDKIETVSGISGHVEENLSGGRTYSYPEYEENQAAVYGNILLKEITVHLSEQQDHAAIAADQPGPLATTSQIPIQTITTQPAPNPLGFTPSVSVAQGNIANASSQNCQVTEWPISGFTIDSPIVLLPNGNVVVYGKDNSGMWKLQSYDQTNGRRRSSVGLAEQPSGMAGVTLAGIPTVALAYKGNQKKIDFHRADELHGIVHTYQVDPRLPGRLCTVASSTLMYEDLSKRPRSQFVWLDCRDAEPKPAAGENIEQHDWIRDTCFVQNGDKQLKVTTRGRGGCDAYNTETDELEWRIEGKIPGFEKDMIAADVTSNGRGYLFVCDGYSGNNCIQMFSVDSTYLGVLLREGEQELGVPTFIRWNETTSSLVVGHRKERPTISVVNIL